MAAYGRAADVSHVSYEQAGHSLMVSASTTSLDAGGPPRMTFDLGGTDGVNAEARKDAALRITEFFGAQLQRPIPLKSHSQTAMDRAFSPIGADLGRHPAKNGT